MNIFIYVYICTQTHTGIANARKFIILHHHDIDHYLYDSHRRHHNYLIIIELRRNSTKYVAVVIGTGFDYLAIMAF